MNLLLNHGAALSRGLAIDGFRGDNGCSSDLHVASAVREGRCDEIRGWIVDAALPHRADRS